MESYSALRILEWHYGSTGLESIPDTWNEIHAALVLQSD
jgi:hypothetical protein